MTVSWAVMKVTAAAFCIKSNFSAGFYVYLRFLVDTTTSCACGSIRLEFLSRTAFLIFLFLIYFRFFSVVLSHESNEPEISKSFISSYFALVANRS